MKKKLLLSMLLVASLSSANAQTDNPGDYYIEECYDVYLYETPVSETPDLPVLPPIKEERKPSKRIVGSLSLQNGVVIPGVNVSEIYSFEIYDMDGQCIGLFCDQESFVEAVFIYQENIQIRLLTADFALVGII